MADEVKPRAGELTTTNYGWTKPTVGSSADAWGGYINADLDGIDSTVHSIQTSDAAKLPLAGGTLTGALKPASVAGITGTTTNDNAQAGAVGEFVRADQLTNVALTSGVTKNIATLSLTAGDWDVEGWISLGFSSNAAQIMCAAVSTTSANIPNTPYDGVNVLIATGQTLAAGTLPTGSLRVSIAATTTVYLVAQAGFTAGTCTAQGSIRARRVR